MVTFYCAIQSRDRHKVIWSQLWKALTILLIKTKKETRIQGSFVSNNAKNPKEENDPGKLFCRAITVLDTKIYLFTLLIKANMWRSGLVV